MAEIDWKEARRYLGLHRGGGTVDEVLEAGLRDCGRALMACARPRSVWRRFPLALGEGRVETAGLQVESLHLRRHLEGCTAVCLFAATLGPEVDRLLHRASVTDVSRAVMIQACAASLLEVYCDECCAAIAAQTAAEGLTLRPRFSPGYGDFPLTAQPELLRRLDGPRKIGLTATDTCLLAPIKSVTAVIGVANTPGKCHAGGCATCSKINCAFRR